MPKKRNPTAVNFFHFVHKINIDVRRSMRLAYEYSVTLANANKYYTNMKYECGAKLSERTREREVERERGREGGNRFSAILVDYLRIRK